MPDGRGFGGMGEKEERIKKNKLTVTRGTGVGDNGEIGKGHQGTCIKDPWTKPKEGRIEGGRWGWVG